MTIRDPSSVSALMDSVPDLQLPSGNFSQAEGASEGDCGKVIRDPGGVWGIEHTRACESGVGQLRVLDAALSMPG